VPQSDVVKAWLACVNAVPFATSGEPPEIVAGDLKAICSALNATFLHQSEKLEHETTLWLECALLARYASACSLAGDPLTPDVELALLSAPPGGGIASLIKHLSDVQKNRPTASASKLDALIKALGVSAKVYSHVPVGWQAALPDPLRIAGAIGSDGGGELPPLVRDWPAVLETARKSDDRVIKASHVVAIRTTLLFTKYYFLRSRVRFSTRSVYHRNIVTSALSATGGEMMAGFSPLAALSLSLFMPVLSYLWFPLYVVDALVANMRTAFSTSQALASEYHARVENLHALLVSPPRPGRGSSVAELEMSLHEQLCVPLLALLARNPRLLHSPEQYHMFSTSLAQRITAEVAEPHLCRALLQFIALLHPVAIGRRSLAAKPVVPIAGQQNAGKSTLVSNLFPDAAAAANVVAHSGEHTRRLHVLPLDDMIVIDCPALVDSSAAGAYRSLTLDLCAVARVAIFIMDVEHGNDATVPGLLKSVLIAAVASGSVQRVLVCCNRIDHQWREIERDEARSLVRKGTGARLQGLSRDAALNAAYALAREPASAKTLAKFDECLVTVQAAVAAVLPPGCSIQIDAVPAVLGDSFGRGETPLDEVIAHLEGAAVGAGPDAAPAAAATATLRPFDGDGAMPRPRLPWRVWRPADVLAWLKLSFTVPSISLRDDVVLGERIGAGGFGVVFRATCHGQDVAVKLYPEPVAGSGGAAGMAAGVAAASVAPSREALASTPPAVEDLYREVTHQAALPSHPHLLRLFGTVYGQVAPATAAVLAAHAARPDRPSSDMIAAYSAGRFVGIVMPLVDGGSLSAHLRSRSPRIPHTTPPSLRQRVEWILQIASGVAFMHAHGHAHGDLKAGNVLLHRGRALVADFGLAALVSASATRSQGRPRGPTDNGTLIFQAPEQLRPTAAGALGTSKATDTYSFAITAAEVRMPSDARLTRGCCSSR
jgi:hypothetical protein